MHIVRIVLQLLGLVVLIPAVALATIYLQHRDADGPSILVPGGALVSGPPHTGPEPDWRFTDAVPVVELQLTDPVSSRRVWIAEAEGRIFVPSGYMTSWLGRIWKHWAYQAEQGDGRAVVRIAGTRYERRLERVREGPILAAVAAKLGTKYGAAFSRADIEAGHTWIFELAAPEE
jgi:hypothetical protein